MSIEVSPKEIFTVPTAMSATGYALVHDGIRRGITTPAGINEVFWGRVLDLVDGFAARYLDQATRFGAFADAAFDKKATQEILDAVSEEDLIPEIFEGAIKTQNASNAALTVAAKIRHPHAELSPTGNGKHSMFLQGMALGSYALSETIREDRPKTAMALRVAGHTMAAAGLFYKGTKTTGDYVRRLR